MYNSSYYDDQPHDEIEHQRRRSPVSKDHQYRSSRHDSSRSPRRTPPRGPRGEDSYRSRRSPDYRKHHDSYRRDASPGYRHGYSSRTANAGLDSHEQDHVHYGEDGARDDHSYRRRASPGRGRSRKYRDYDDPRGRNYRGSRRSDSRGSSPFESADDGHYHETPYRSRPGRPYHTLKLDGIPDDLTSGKIEHLLRDMGAKGLIDIRIKSGDRNGSRRCYAFAEFRSDGDATDFLDKHYPALDIDGAGDSPVRIYLDYSRERRQNPNPDDWKCTLCHFENFSRRTTCKQCKAPRSIENTADMKLDGKSDECPQQTPSQFIVIRGLPPSATETILAARLKDLYVAKEDEPKQSSGTPAKLKSTAPIGNTSGLGAKPSSLVRVFIIREKSTDISCNYGFAEFSSLDDARAAIAKYNASPQFALSSKPVTIAFIHSGVFIPYLHPVHDQDPRYTFAATHNPSLRLVYWNPSVYANESILFNESLYEDKAHGPNRLRKDADASVARDSKKRKVEKEAAASNGKKAIAMAPQLQAWANKHAELHGQGDANRTDPGTNNKPPVNGSDTIGAKTLGFLIPMALAPSVSFADLDQMCCMLCRRKFSNEPSLRRHEQISDMHKGNLGNEGLVAKATGELNVLGKEPVAAYRDRAKERRMVHNQPTRPKAHLPRKTPQSSKESEPAANLEHTKTVVSKGAGLLAKMGWTTGEGLGAEGGGRTEIIETLAYNPGVGLGAEGGKMGNAAEEAARATAGDYTDFLSKTKDKARERYQKMS